MREAMDPGDPDDLAAGGLESLEITIDAGAPAASARSWEAALNYERLYERPPYVALGPTARGSPRVLVQHVPAVASEKSRVHLDLRVRDPAGEGRRLESLGAALQEVVTE